MGRRRPDQDNGQRKQAASDAAKGTASGERSNIRVKTRLIEKKGGNKKKKTSRGGEKTRKDETVSIKGKGNKKGHQTSRHSRWWKKSQKTVYGDKRKNQHQRDSTGHEPAKGKGP